MERLIFHVDVNSAFLSWEAARRVKNGESDLRLVPSIVGGDPERRSSIVAAKSIPAKAYGINTGEPVSMALRKCPELVVVKPDFKLYDECSRAFKKICHEYSPTVESFSIDEVFIDMSGMGRMYPDPLKTAHEIKDRIREELGFTVNIGIAHNKLCAKMASDFQKPDRVHTLFENEIKAKMWPLAVGELFTIGRTTAGRLTAYGIKTIGELACADRAVLTAVLGDRLSVHAWEFANGIDASIVKSEREEAKGYSVETTLEDDLADILALDRILLSLADVVAARIRRAGVKCGCVAVHYRSSTFKNKSHQKKLSQVTDVTGEIYEVACELFRECWEQEPLRLIGLSLTDIDHDEYEQLSLFKDERKEKLKKLDDALDSIRGRYGNDSVQRASTAVNDSRIGRKFKATQ